LSDQVKEEEGCEEGGRRWEVGGRRRRRRRREEKEEEAFKFWALRIQVLGHLALVLHKAHRHLPGHRYRMFRKYGS
jgi:hypothetical protein